MKNNVMRNSNILLMSLLCTQFIQPASQVEALKAVFSSQQRSIKRAINDLINQRSIAEDLHLNTRQTELQQLLTVVSESAIENLQKFSKEIEKEIAKLKEEFRALQVIQTINGYEIAEKTYESNLQPILTNTTIALNLNNIYAYILDISDTKVANAEGLKLNAQQILQKLKEKLANNPRQPQQNWIMRQLTYIFTNDALKTQYDHFLMGKKAFEAWEKNNLISADELISRIEQNAEAQLAYESLKDQVSALTKWVENPTN